MNTGNSTHATGTEGPDTSSLNGTSGFVYFEKHQHAMTCLQKRHIKNIRRETWLHAGHKLIVKRYIRTALFPDIRRLWLRESKALNRLKLSGMPRVRGMSTRRTQEGREILLFRDHVDGAPLQRLSDAPCRDILDALTPIYQRGVLTCDPTAENILQTPDGHLQFIDFSKGRIFALKTPLFYHYLGKEFIRIIKLNSDAAINWPDFKQAFIHSMGLNGLALRLFNAGCRHWATKWKISI